MASDKMAALEKNATSYPGTTLFGGKLYRSVFGKVFPVLGYFEKSFSKYPNLGKIVEIVTQHSPDIGWSIAIAPSFTQ